MLKRVRSCRTCQDYQWHVDRFLVVLGSARHFLSWSGADTEEEIEYDPGVCTDSRDSLTVDPSRFFLGGRSRGGSLQDETLGLSWRKRVKENQRQQAPAFKGLRGMMLDAGQIAEQIRKGKPNGRAPHSKSTSAVSDEQAKAIADYIKTLK